MSGLTGEQLDELEERVAELLEEPWDKGYGRPRELTFREALTVACGYARNNITEEIWAEIFDVGQSTISRYITLLTPLIDQATGSSGQPRKTRQKPPGTRSRWSMAPYGHAGPGREAQAMVREIQDNWSRVLIITNLQGRITFVSVPVPGNQHDMAKLKGAECETVPKMAGGVFGDKGFIGTDYSHAGPETGRPGTVQYAR